MNELEIIRHPQREGFSMFFNTVDYRTPHIHPEWELIWVVENSLVVNSQGKEYILEPGQMIVFNPNEPHEFHKVKESATFLCMQISSKILPEILPAFIDEKRVDEHLSKEEMQTLKDELVECMMSYLQRDEHFTLYCVGKGSLILYQLLHKMPSHILTTEETSSMDKRNERLKHLLVFVLFPMFFHHRY